MRRRGIITGGTWCVDRNKLVDFWPHEDGIARIISDEPMGGGSGCNLAVDIRKLDPGFPIETIALVGDDADGRFLAALADEYGIGREQMHMTREAPTNYTDAFASKATGRRTHLYYPGAASLLTPDHFDFSSTAMRILHLGLPGVHERMDIPWQGEANGWVAVLKQARAAGLETNLELCSVEEARLAALVRPCLPSLDTLIVNDMEIGAIVGIPTLNQGKTDIEACIAAARRVLEMGAMRVAVAHFPAGAVAVVKGGEATYKPSLRVPESEIKGANGAGDAFATGFLYAIHESWPLAEALALAHAVAGASLRSVTTSGAVESWRRCLDLARAWGERGTA